MSFQVATSYTHVQDTAASTWTVVHNMYTYPITDVYIMVNGEITKVYPSVTFTDETTTTVTFTSPQTGFVRCG
jgi:hypothetical protein